MSRIWRSDLQLNRRRVTADESVVPRDDQRVARGFQLIGIVQSNVALDLQHGVVAPHRLFVTDLCGGVRRKKAPSNQCK
jgi:hypothetical protein